MEGRVDGWVSGWIVECMGVGGGGGVCVRIDGWMNGWVSGTTNG